MINCNRCMYMDAGKVNCTAVGGFCTAVPAAYCPMLQKYLDTRLTPSDVHSLWGEWDVMMSVLNSIGGGYERLRELAEADKEGRLVVLPCEVGTATYYIHYPIAFYPDESEPEIKRGIFTLIDLDRFGHSVFLTREEAEKALEAMQDG